MLCGSKLVPQHFQGDDKFCDCMIALDMAARLEASVFMIMQHLYVVHGKPGWSGQFVTAMINRSGRFKPLLFEFSEKRDQCIAWTVDKNADFPPEVNTLAKAKERGLRVYESVPVTMTMVKAEGWLDKNGSKWKSMPDVMFQYRTASFFGKTYCPEMLMGMPSMDELEDHFGLGVAVPTAAIPGAIPIVATVVPEPEKKVEKAAKVKKDTAPEDTTPATPPPAETTAAPDPVPAQPAGEAPPADAASDLVKLGSMLLDIGCNEPLFLQWMFDSKYFSKPLKSMNEMTSVMPKKLAHLVDQWEAGPYKKNIVAFIASKAAK